MSIENCLMGITVFDLKDKKLITEICKNLMEEGTHVFHNGYSPSIEKLILFDLEHTTYFYDEDIFSEVDLEDVLNNPDRYLLLNIDWNDNAIENEMENVGYDILLEKHILKTIKDFSFTVIRLQELYIRYLVLLFEFWSDYNSYEGEYDCSMTFKGIVNMDKIEVI